MSMVINFFAIPAILIQTFSVGSMPVVKQAEYVNEVYTDSGAVEVSKDTTPPPVLYYKEQLNLDYYKSFSILEKLYEFVFAKKTLSLTGRQSLTKQENDVLLKEYVGYSGGYLTFEDIQNIHKQLINLPFKNFIKMAFGEDDSKRTEAIDFIAEDTMYSEKEIIEELLCRK